MVSINAARLERAAYSLRSLCGSAALRLGDSFSFTGKVTGFASDNTLDFNDLMFGEASSVSYDAATRTLNVTDGTKAASVALEGDYSRADFRLESDEDGSTLLRYNDLLS